jgi:hypothetical protein
MQLQTLKTYLFNCLWLLVPVMLFDGLLTARLPAQYQMDVFWKDIPAFIATGENLFRIIVFILPLLMPLSITTRPQKIGLWVYLLGTLVYFLSWAAQILWPHSAWSLSLPGALAPAYTALFWLVGIGLIGSRLYFKSPYRPWMYITLSGVFIAFHLAHSWLIFGRV